MNKYKMISMCSLTIVFVLIMSLLLPMTITANEKESLKMKWLYEDSTVTVNIAVNSDTYTSVICKYMEIDNILLCEDIMEEVKNNGTLLNVNETSQDNYEVKINDISKRYVVVYTTIGNCELCDYIDCEPTDEEKTEEPEEKKEPEQEENKQSEEKEENKEAQEEQEVIEEIKEENSEQIKEESTDIPEVKEEQSKQNKEEKTENQNNPDDDFEEIEEVKKDESNNEEQTKNEEEEINIIDTIIKKTEEIIEKENIKIDETTPDNKEDIKEEIKKEIEEENKKEEQQKESSVNPINIDEIQKENNVKNEEESTKKSEPETGKQNVVKEINDDGFEEIKSIDKVSTADTSMPQTGEDDGFKIFGIVIFSIISAVSFYKYKTTK